MIEIYRHIPPHLPRYRAYLFPGKSKHNLTRSNSLVQKIWPWCIVNGPIRISRLVQGEVRNASVTEIFLSSSQASLGLFIRLRDKTRMRQKSVPLDWFMKGLSKVIRIVDRGQVVWKSYLNTHTPLRGPTGLASMSSPEPTCLLVSAKSRSSGRINFRNSKILGVAPGFTEKWNKAIIRTQTFTTAARNLRVYKFSWRFLCAIFVNYKLFYTR